MSAPSATDFLSMVRKSGVLDEKRFSEYFSDPNELPEDPTECANALIKAGLLTTFQARQILSGKYRGLVLGVYKILRPLGQGGMGVVYAAEHASLQRRVALKVLPAKQARDQVTVERFMREARATAALDHPNIVRLHDVCQGAGVHFLVMELVEGKDLQTLLSETGPLHYATAVSYIAQAAAGLQHAHSKGIVHRDIKPANLMITKDGVVKILDMGLARSFTDDNDNLTATLGEDGSPLGTIDYVAPEQALGQAVDERCDLYSLGATLFHLLTGQPPYKGSRTQVLMQHQVAEPPQLSKTLKINVPQTLNGVIAKMMAKKKGDRFQTAEEVIDALSPWLPAPQSSNNVQQDALSTQELREAGVTTQSARSLTKKERKRKRREAAAALAKQKKWYLIGGASLALLVVGILLVMLGGGSKKNTTGQTPDPFKQSGPGGNSLVEESQLVLSPPEGINDVVVSRDGTQYAAVDWAGNLHYGSPGNWQKSNMVAVQGKPRLNSCAGTPDGRYVLVGGYKTPVLVYDWKTGKKAGEFPSHDDTTWGIAVSPTGNTVLTCGSDGEVILRDFATGNVVRRYEFESKQVWSVAFSPDGTKFAASCGGSDGNPAASHQIRIWDMASGQELRRLSGHARDVRWVAFSPDNRQLASASFDGTVRLWDVGAGTHVRTFNANPGGYVERVSFLPGQRLLSGGSVNGGDRAGAVRVWDLNAQEIKAWKGFDAKGIIAMTPSPDGTYALTGSRERTIRLWKMPNR
jgi:serine/threonine protein kinase